MENVLKWNEMFHGMEMSWNGMECNLFSSFVNTNYTNNYTITLSINIIIEYHHE